MNSELYEPAPGFFHNHEIVNWVKMSKTLDPEVIKLAYLNGYFPMPEPDTQDILWYRPDPRAIIPLDSFHVSRSLKRSMRQRGYAVSYNLAFEQVMRGCAARPDTWINQEFIRVYTQLHKQGFAHSVEVWHDGQLVGGVYGVAFCAAFHAESKFHTMRDASKIALYCLVELLKARQFELLEVQFLTPHLARLGAIEISDEQYMKLLRQARSKRPVL